MIEATGNLHNITEWRDLNRDPIASKTAAKLPIATVAAAPYGSIIFKKKGKVVACGDGSNTAESNYLHGSIMPDIKATVKAKLPVAI